MLKRQLIRLYLAASDLEMHLWQFRLHQLLSLLVEINHWEECSEWLSRNGWCKFSYFHSEEEIHWRRSLCDFDITKHKRLQYIDELAEKLGRMISYNHVHFREEKIKIMIYLPWRFCFSQNYHKQSDKWWEINLPFVYSSNEVVSKSQPCIGLLDEIEKAWGIERTRICCPASLHYVKGKSEGRALLRKKMFHQWGG